jgi:hypothetical protein
MECGGGHNDVIGGRGGGAGLCAEAVDVSPYREPSAQLRGILTAP